IPGRRCWKMTLTVEARSQIQRQLDRLAYLWGTGPVTIDYAQWVDNTTHLLKAIFGDDAPPVARFYEAVGQEGATYAQKLPVHGPWGIWERMRQAEAALREVLSQL
ncbi:MAG: hypothetical protein ACE5IZ_07675, partial [Dehalococcoidia bacterium]